MEDNKDIKIENDTAVWALREEGLIKGTYTGVFRFRCFLAPTMRIAANREYRELLGANPAMAGEHESELAWALTQLKYRVLESPPFWNATLQNSRYAGDLEDSEIIKFVLDAAVRAELKYVTELKKKKEESIKLAKKAAEQILETQEKEATEGAEDENET